MITLQDADLSTPEHATALVSLLNEYTLDPRGGGQPLPESVQQLLAEKLSVRQDALVVLAFAGA